MALFRPSSYHYKLTRTPGHLETEKGVYYYLFILSCPLNFLDL